MRTKEGLLSLSMSRMLGDRHRRRDGTVVQSMLLLWSYCLHLYNPSSLQTEENRCVQPVRARRLLSSPRFKLWQNSHRLHGWQYAAVLCPQRHTHILRKWRAFIRAASTTYTQQHPLVSNHFHGSPFARTRPLGHSTMHTAAAEPGTPGNHNSNQRMRTSLARSSYVAA